jgi:nucleotide-binding universal stress UspA family protein
VLNPFEVAGSAHFTPEQIERFAGEELRRFLAASRLGTPPRLSRVRVGYPRDVILAVLKERRADLAVLGTHGRGGFERLMLGSVAAGVMHEAHCNLLIVPPEAGFQEEPVSREAIQGKDWIFVSDVAPVSAGK